MNRRSFFARITGGAVLAAIPAAPPVARTLSLSADTVRAGAITASRISGSIHSSQITGAIPASMKSLILDFQRHGLVK